MSYNNNNRSQSTLQWAMFGVVLLGQTIAFTHFLSQLSFKIEMLEPSVKSSAEKLGDMAIKLETLNNTDVMAHDRLLRIENWMQKHDERTESSK